MQIKAVVKGASHLQRYVKAQWRQEVKALETAIRVEGYRLSKKLKQEIRAGAFTGGDEKSGIARKLSRQTTPLKKLATAVRYHVVKSPNFQIHVGWTGPRVSKSWQRIATQQQEGFTRPVTDRQASFLRSVGGGLAKRSKYRKYFFLKKTTKEMTTPARPIIAPFWRKHEAEAMARIKNNYLRKLRGERI